MSEFVVVNLMVILFRTIMIGLGFGFAYLGYKLFVKGVYERAGELKAAWGDKNLVLKQAAPGTFFALFGVAVIAISILQGTGLEISENSNIPKVSISVQDYPEIKNLLNGEGLKIEGSWEKAQLELAVLHNIRAIWQQSGIPGESFKSMFHDVLVPTLKEKPGADRGRNIGSLRNYLVYSINTQPIVNVQPTEPAETYKLKKGLGVD